MKLGKESWPWVEGSIRWEKVQRRLAEWRVVEWRLAEWRVAEWRLAEWRLAEWLLVEWRVAEWLLAEWRLAEWLLVSLVLIVVVMLLDFEQWMMLQEPETRSTGAWHVREPCFFLSLRKAW